MTGSDSHTAYRAVAAARALRGQTQAELAGVLTEKTGERWTRGMVANLEGGRRSLDWELLRTLSEIQQLPLEFYVYGPASGSGAVSSASPCSLINRSATPHHASAPRCAGSGSRGTTGCAPTRSATSSSRTFPALVGTAGSDEDAARRAWIALDWSARVSTPAWLDLAGLADHAQHLRALPEQVEP
ncbi:MAG: helix-turn-helix domain-containing protein, partial [Actinomycetota bacterium]|nr:helix-turn-helix domain-containing protein [Actinomycetota bacterium]